MCEPGIFADLRRSPDFREGGLKCLAERTPATRTWLVKRLRASLSHDDPGLRFTSVTGLSDLGELRWGEELQLMCDPDFRIRQVGAFRLSKVFTRAATTALVTALGRADGRDGPTIAWALGHRRRRSAVPDLLQALKSHGEPTRQFAAEALGKIGDVRALRPVADELLRSPQGSALRRVYAVAVARLCERAFARSTPWRRLKGVVNGALRCLTSWAVVRRDPRLRAGAAWVAGWVGDSEALRQLAEMCKCETVAWVEAAANASINRIMRRDDFFGTWALAKTGILEELSDPTNTEERPYSSDDLIETILVMASLDLEGHDLHEWVERQKRHPNGGAP